MECCINKKDPLGIYPFIKTVNDFPIKGIKFRDITSLIENQKAFVKTCKELTRISREYSAKFIVSIKSRGFIFSRAVAYLLYLPGNLENYLMIRLRKIMILSMVALLLKYKRILR